MANPKVVYQQSPVASGRIEFAGPTFRKVAGKAGVWDVRIIDTVIEEEITKTFTTKGKGEAFILEQTRGPQTTRNRHAQSKMAELWPDAKQITRNATAGVDRRGGKKVATGEGAGRKFNLRPVIEVLEEYGLDPTAEIAKVLGKTRKVKGKDGQPDEEVHLVEGVDRAKVLTELIQYVQPKLKSVEMKVKDERVMTDEEIDARIKRLQADTSK